MSDLNLYDAVIVKASGNIPALDGVVAYVKGNTVGVRLTGSSVGLGDHSGTVDGIEYFECPLNSGIMTTRSEIEVRQLSRIEELKLKRELAAGQLQASYGGGISTAASASKYTPPRSTTKTTASTSSSSPVSTSYFPKTRPTPPPPIPISGLSATALQRMQKLNETYMAETIGQPSVKTTTTKGHEQEEEEEEMLVSSDDSSEDNDDDVLQTNNNKSRIEDLRRQREEIQRRKMALSASTSTSTTLTSTTTKAQDEKENVIHGAKPDEETIEKPFSKLEQLKLKKRQLESTPPRPTTTTTEQTPSKLEQLRAKKRNLESVPAKAIEEPPPPPPGLPPDDHEEQQEADVKVRDIHYIPNQPKYIRVRIQNGSTQRSKDLLVEVSDKLTMFDSIYNLKVVKEADIRKWNMTIATAVRSGKSEITCTVSTLPPPKDGQQQQQEKVFSIDELKQVTTQKLWSDNVPRYDASDASSIIYLLLQCIPDPTNDIDERRSSVLSSDNSSSFSFTLKAEEIKSSNDFREAQARRVDSALEQLRRRKEFTVDLNDKYKADAMKRLSMESNLDRSTLSDSSDLDLIETSKRRSIGSRSSSHSSIYRKGQERGGRRRQRRETRRRRSNSLDNAGKHDSFNSNSASTASDPSIDPEANPYAEAATLITPSHETVTTFQDLKMKPNGFEVSLPQDVETGQKTVKVQDEDSSQVDAEAQTNHIGDIEAAETDIEAANEKQRQRRAREQREQERLAEEQAMNYTCPKAQKIDVLWWFAIMAILFGGFIIALFMGPIN